WIRMEAVGQEHFPRSGPVLVISNHVGFMDPVVIILSANRPVSFMATPSLLDEGMLARVMQWFGVVPKKKFIADTSAIRRLKAWAKHGGAVGLFPEAVRCWDGRTATLMPGTERLVKMLKVPVVTVRLRNAYRQWPRWAERARSGKVRIEFDPPKVFEKGTSDEEIMAYLTERLQVRHDEEPAYPVRGGRLARGVTNVLWACHACDAFAQMREDDTHVSCDACGARWRVDGTTDLIHEETGERTRIDAFIDHNVATLRARDMIPFPERFAQTGVLLESEPMELIERTDDAPLPVASGRLQLHKERLAVLDEQGSAVWSLLLEEIRVVTVDMRRRLQFRTMDRLYEAMIPTESVVKWELVAKHWMPKAK
ncbi:MAG: lysophospholipid acyltransferase family protein, partial [Nannocystaceae bacterium]